MTRPWHRRRHDLERWSDAPGGRHSGHGAALHAKNRLTRTGARNDYPTPGDGPRPRTIPPWHRWARQGESGGRKTGARLPRAHGPAWLGAPAPTTDAIPWITADRPAALPGR